MSRNSFSLDLDGISISVTAPYCTAEQWSERTGIPEADVKSRLYKGTISRYQPVPRGDVFVNVLQEVSKTLEAKPY